LIVLNIELTLSGSGQAERSRQRGDIVTLTTGQLSKLSLLMDEWSFLWDKRRSLWIAAEDSPDGEQIEEADLDVLLARVERSAHVQNP
jgi:hypothetical protein